VSGKAENEWRGGGRPQVAIHRHATFSSNQYYYYYYFNPGRKSRDLKNTKKSIKPE